MCRPHLWEHGQVGPRSGGAWLADEFSPLSSALWYPFAKGIVSTSNKSFAVSSKGSTCLSGQLRSSITKYGKRG